MPDATSSTRSTWRLTQEAFDAFLARLDPDRARAGERYEALRAKLVRFFDWSGVRAAEEWADETINRAARKIEEGEEVRNLQAYCGGVARMVAREATKAQERAQELDERTPAPADDEETAELERRRECLRSCLAALPPDHRELVLGYFAGDSRARIDGRKELAARLGVELNALRIRVHRIRAKLELCVRDCVNRAGGR